MGTWEKNLIMVIINYFFRWLMSNERNKKAREEAEKKKAESEGKIDSNQTNDIKI